MGNNQFDRIVNRHHNKAKYRYRILMRRDRSSPQPVWFTSDREYARMIACRINEGAAVERAWVEEWTRFAEFSDWRRLIEAAELRAFNDKPNGLSCRLFQSGTMIEAELLRERTKRGGWRAKLLRYHGEGPITNSAEVPRDASPGDRVFLRLEASNRDGSHLQWSWIPQSR